MSLSQSNLDVLLLMCPPWDISQPPLNLAYLSAYASANGVRARSFDLNIRLSNMARNMGLKELWLVMSQNAVSPGEMAEKIFSAMPQVITGVLSRILAFNTPVLGFSVHMRNLPFTEHLVQLIREKAPARKIILGGPEVTISHALGTTRRLRADALVVGEGEQTLVELMQTLKSHGRFTEVPGALLPVEGGYSDLVPRPEIRPLDSLPFPDWKDFDLPWYSPDETVDPHLPMLFSRGCTGACTFCVDHGIAGRFRHRTAQNLLGEVRRNVEQHHVKAFSLNDLICNGHVGVLEQFADMIIAEDLPITWWSYAVIRKQMTAEVCRKLRAAGCTSLIYGLESGSDPVLKAMGKHYTVQTAEEVLKNSTEAGLATGVNIIVGYPGETRAEFQQTLDFISRNQRYINRVVNLGTCLRSPGSALYSHPEEYGILLDQERGTWYRDDGNTIEERNWRLQQVQDHLDRLNIPRVVLNREVGFDHFSSVVNRVQREGSIDRGIHIIDLLFLDMTEQETRNFEPGGLMTLCLRFRVTRAVSNAVVRVQFFTNENPAQQNLLIFGMNTDRAGIKLGPLARGWVEARLVIYQLALAPGKYITTVGIYPDVDTLSGLDVKHGEHMFRVNGQPDLSGARVHTPCRWSMEPGGLAAERGVDRMAALRILDGEGLELPSFRCGLPLTLQMECHISDPQRVSLVVDLVLRDLVVFRVQRPGLLPPGSSLVGLHFEAFPLLEGSFEAVARLEDTNSAEEISSVRAGLRVSSLNAQGGGLIQMPSAWEIDTHLL